MTELLHCNSIAILKKKSCVLFTIKLNVLLVDCTCFLNRGVMSELESGGEERQFLEHSSSINVAWVLPKP